MPREASGFGKKGAAATPQSLLVEATEASSRGPPSEEAENGTDGLPVSEPASPFAPDVRLMSPSVLHLLLLLLSLDPGWPARQEKVSVGPAKVRFACPKS